MAVGTAHSPSGQFHFDLEESLDLGRQIGKKINLHAILEIDADDAGAQIRPRKRLGRLLLVHPSGPSGWCDAA